jgi:hypothetical protein
MLDEYVAVSELKVAISCCTIASRNERSSSGLLST